MQFFINLDFLEKLWGNSRHNHTFFVNVGWRGNRGKWTKGELTEDKDRGPGDNVILVSRVTQRPGLPDGGLEGLVKAALGLRSHTNTQMAEKYFLSHSNSHIKQASCDAMLTGRCNL